ncbi:MAG: hypothetical protein WCO06_03610 [Candidatus Roizmanbacteria bacterium]
MKKQLILLLLLVGFCFILPHYFNTVHAAKAFLVVRVTTASTNTPLNDVVVTWVDHGEKDGCGNKIMEMTKKSGEKSSFKIYYDSAEFNEPNIPGVKISHTGSGTNTIRIIEPNAGIAVISGDENINGGRFSCNCGVYDFKISPPTNQKGYFTLENGTRLTDEYLEKGWSYQDIGNVGPVKEFKVKFVSEGPIIKPVLPTQIVVQPTIAGVTLAPTVVTVRPTTTTTTGSTATTKSRRFVCLQADYCQNNGVSCQNVADASKKNSAKLSLKDGSATDKTLQLLPDKDSYIVECMQLGTARYCTTGNKSLDITAFGNSIGYDKAIATPYEYKKIKHINSTSGSIAPNPIKGAPADSQLGIWESTTKSQVGRIFMAYGEFESSSYSDYVGAMQQSSLNFIADQKKCIQIFWDPYGTVFDGQTMKPLADASVALYKQNASGTFSKVDASDVINGIENPQTTKKDGKYSFHVQDGIYKIEVTHTLYDAYSVTLVQKGNQIQHDIAMKKRKDIIRLF